MARRKILVIEDETELVAMMKMRLEANNYQVISAYDGEKGLKKAQKLNPDLILADIILPKMDGLSLCSHLKADPKMKNIPIIIISASGRKDLPGRCREAGADDVIMKPFEAKELLDEIANHLRS